VRKSSLVKDETTATGLRDLEAIQRFLASPVFTAFFDMPWTPFFLFAIWIFHPWLGTLAIAGGVILVFVTIINQIMTRRPAQRTGAATVAAENVLGQIRTESEMVCAMGMREAAFRRWLRSRDSALTDQILTSDLGGTFTTITRTFRLFLQSAMLGL
jgi:ATP-binding cassette subfamily C protein